jgi:hypothetical protein
MPHRRGRRRTFQLRQIKKSTIMLKAMKSLSFLNLQTSQIKNGEQNLKMKARAEKTAHIQEQPTE